VTEAHAEDVQADEDYTDLVVVSEDDNNLVVQVKNSRGRAIRYALPRHTLDVVFTSTGIQRNEEVEPPKPRAKGDVAPAAPGPMQKVSDRLRRRRPTTADTA